MIPLRDNIQTRRFPLVNYVLIGITSLVFLLQLMDQHQSNMNLVERFGMIPARVLDGDQAITVKRLEVGPGGYHVVYRQAASSPLPVWLTLLTCIFLHGGWMHFIGNMWFLFIFGDNIEDRLGRLGYLAFYLITGVAASATHLWTNSSSSVPTIGASGAIAGVMGAYFLLYPKARVLTLIPFGFLHVIMLPAYLFLGFWFLIQFFQGAMTISSTESGGVAWWAHIGGFAAGFLIVFFLKLTGIIRSRKVVLRSVPRSRKRKNRF